MTKLTNNKNYPEQVVRALEKNYYGGAGSKHDYSASDLLTPPQLFALKRQHKDSIVEDVSDRFWAFLGHMAHNIFEEAADQNKSLTEERMTANIAKWKIGGGMDYYDLEKKEILDYKLTSVYAYMSGSRTDDQTFQLNVYAALLRRCGYEVNSLGIVYIFRDYSGNKSETEGYPTSEIIIESRDLWADEKIVAEIVARAETLDEAKKGIYRQCTAEERWSTPDTYAVMKEGNKRATKIYEKSYEAEAHAAQDKKFFVEYRKGVNKRCDQYCPVRDYCGQRALL